MTPPEPPTTEMAGHGRLNRRLLVWFLVFSLLPLLVTNAIGYRRSQGIITQLVERYLGAIAQVQAQQVRDRTDRALLLLQAVAAGNEFLVAGAQRSQGHPAGAMGEAASRIGMERLLRRKLDEIKLFDALYLFTPDGEIAASVGLRENLSTALPAHEETGSVSALLLSTPRGVRPMFRLVVPVFGSESVPTAFLAGTLSLDGFRDMLQLPSRIAGHVESFIVDAGGRPLFVSHPHDSVDYAVPLVTPLLTLPDGATEQYRADDGASVFGAIVALPDYEWRLIAEVPTDEAFGALRRLGSLSLLFELLLVAVLIGTAIVVSRSIVAPLRRLVHASRRVARGDLSVRVKDDTGDEIGELGHAFNEMTIALAETTNDVRELHRREIERASQLATVGELASGIAHEIKNPVVGVTNGLDIVRRRAGADATLLPIIDEMERQMWRVQDAIQELLTFARPATPALAPVSGDDLVERAIRLVQPTADKGGVRLEIRLDPSHAFVLADAEMIHQALINLLMNAIEATPHGGRVDVYTRTSGDWIEIEITDTGRGIAPEHLESVFKPFFTTRHTGTGLGLSITREIIQRHGGTVTLRSRLGKGTTVTIRLPAHAGIPEAAVQEAAK
jgi:signal transduction histidine kinase